MKKQIAEPTSRLSDSVGLGWGPRICISNRFPGDTDAAGPGPQLENHCLDGISTPFQLEQCLF